MEQKIKNIDGIWKLMNELKDEKYALVNPELMELDEYVKGLYLKVLCTVVQYENEPTIIQTEFLNRIVTGMGVDETMEECMRRALELSETDMQEFFHALHNNQVKYYFVLDGVILAALGKGNRENCEYLAEIAELLDVNEKDFEFLCLVAKSVLQQDSSIYDEAKTKLSERTKLMDCKPYIENYYAGAIVDNEKMKHYYSPDLEIKAPIAFPAMFQEKKIVLENLDINLLAGWLFEGCEEVEFINCRITSIKEEASLLFTSCKFIYVKGCVFKDFQLPVFNETNVQEVYVQNCEFDNCVNYSRGWKEGGVFNSSYSGETGKNTIINCSFTKCGGVKKSYSSYYHPAISNCNCYVEKCRFYNCWIQEDSNGKLSQSSKDPLFYTMEGKDNEIIGSANYVR